MHFGLLLLQTLFVIPRNDLPYCANFVTTELTQIFDILKLSPILSTFDNSPMFQALLPTYDLAPPPSSALESPLLKFSYYFKMLLADCHFRNFGADRFLQQRTLGAYNYDVALEKDLGACVDLADSYSGGLYYGNDEDDLFGFAKNPVGVENVHLQLGWSFHGRAYENSRAASMQPDTLDYSSTPTPVGLSYPSKPSVTTYFSF